MDWKTRLRDPAADVGEIARSVDAVSLVEGLEEALPPERLAGALEAAARAYSGADRLRCLRALAALPGDRARSLDMLATALEDADRLEEAAATLERAVEISPEARLFNRLGTLYHSRGDHARALAAYRRSLDLKRSTGDERGTWNTLLNLATLHRETGDPKSALEAAEHAARLAQDAGRRARATALAAHAALEGGVAGDYLDRARESFRAAGDGEGEAAAVVEQASILARLGRAAEALALLDGQRDLPRDLRARAEALRARLRSGDRPGLLDRVRAILKRRDGPALLRDIVDAAVDLLSAERGFCILSTEGGYEIGAARHMSRESIRNPEFQISRGLADWVAKNGEGVLTGRATAEPALRAFKSLEELQVKSIACAPMRAGDRLVGALYVDHRGRADAFASGDLETLQALADAAAVALEQVRLLEENLRQQKLLEQANARLRATNRSLEQKVRTQTRILDRVTPSGRDRYDQLVGAGPAMQEIYRLLDRIQSSTETVLVTGESGTGKELLARAIHGRSPRAAGPFVSINCGALAETLLESELFGHVKGAFTGAASDRLGVFEQAHEGTLFLDEIGETSPEVQKRLLRVLQEREIRRVGDARDRKVDVRVVAATNRDLEEAVKEERFRRDLFYRLNVIRIQLPPLRERKEDIPLLIGHFLERIATERGGAKPELSAALRERLAGHDWPGNVRQLENAVRRVVAMGEEGFELQESPPTAVAPAELKTLEEVELEHIRRVLAATGGNVTEASKILGVGSATLWRRLRKMDLRPDQSDRSV